MKVKDLQAALRSLNPEADIVFHAKESDQVEEHALFSLVGKDYDIDEGVTAKGIGAGDDLELAVDGLGLRIEVAMNRLNCDFYILPKRQFVVSFDDERGEE